MHENASGTFARNIVVFHDNILCPACILYNLCPICILKYNLCMRSHVNFDHKVHYVQCTFIYSRNVSFSNILVNVQILAMIIQSNLSNPNFPYADSSLYRTRQLVLNFFIMYIMLKKFGIRTFVFQKPLCLSVRPFVRASSD